MIGKEGFSRLWRERGPDLRVTIPKIPGEPKEGLDCGGNNEVFVYLVKQNGNHKRVTWDSWDKLKLYNESLAAHIKWTNKVKETIRFLKKKSAFKAKLRKRIKIKREPVIKRTPVKIKKKRHRRSR